MKHVQKIWMLLLMVLSFVSCTKNFLDEQPDSEIPSSAFYKTAEDMEQALNAAYASLQAEGQYGTANWQVGEVRSDNTYNWDGSGNFPDAEIDQFRESSSNSILNDMWLDTYNGIQLCNIVIDRIAAVEMTDILRKRYVAEALFLRSLMYFNLVRTFGDVPLVLHETLSPQEGYAHARVPVIEIYDQLIRDLQQSAEDLPDHFTGLDVGRATRGASKALLAKIWLTIGNYQQASDALFDIVQSGTYQLLPDYADLWNTANANNEESIFEVQYKKGGTGTGSRYTNYFAPRGSEAIVTTAGTAYGRNLATNALVAAFEPRDLRKNASLRETYTRNSEEVYDPYTVKFRDVPFTEWDADNNWVVLRYADVLLMYAEALNEVNSGPVELAYKAVNTVRLRAGLNALPAGLNKTDFALAIEHERQVELAFEGHRWFDLVRTKRALDIMNAHFNGTITIQSYQLLFPIPQSQVNINPGVITQNEGY